MAERLTTFMSGCYRLWRNVKVRRPKFEKQFLNFELWILNSAVGAKLFLPANVFNDTTKPNASASSIAKAMFKTRGTIMCCGFFCVPGMARDLEVQVLWEQFQRLASALSSGKTLRPTA